jgi:surface protein
MFSECYKLKELDLSSWNVKNEINTSYMFEYCQNLETIYASKKFNIFDENNNYDYNMFY